VIKHGCDHIVQCSHNDILVISGLGIRNKIEPDNCSIVQTNHREVRVTCGQGFEDSFNGRNFQDGDPNVAIRDQTAYKWKYNDR
jgi:hypothetical protein